MNKNILILSTSPRKGGNSDTLADAFGKGAIEGNNCVEKISLAERSIGFCKGCLACQKTGKCVIHDDADTIAKKMLLADVIVFATPIYYYEMCGQMKTMLDRANPLYSSEYKFSDIYLLSAAAENDPHAADGAVKGLSGWIACFAGARLKNTVFAGGVDVVGAIKGHPALEKSYEMGKSI